MPRRLFPAFLDLKGRDVLLVGGGAVATAKFGQLVDAGAQVTVVAPYISPEILPRAIAIRDRAFEPADLEGRWYVVAAAPAHINADVVREANLRRVFVNAVDDPENASAYAGSLVRRGPVTIAISTGGEAPALAGLLREALERLFPVETEAWVQVATRLRSEWRAAGVPMAGRRALLLQVLSELHTEGSASANAEPTSAATVSLSERPGERSLDREGTRLPDPAPRARRGHVSLVGAGPGDLGLLTQRAAERLGRADLVLYDALVSPEIVALATRAQRVFVGRRRGRETVAQATIHRALIGAARRGRQVVRLKGGDPFLFGRGGEEALALAHAGVSFDVVPGVSSALAAPALASIPVTHRDISAAVVITTGHDAARFRLFAQAAITGNLTLIVMMGLAERARIAAELVMNGWASATPAAVIRAASTPDAEVWTGTLDDLACRLDPESDRTLPGTLVIGPAVSLRAHLAAPHIDTAPHRDLSTIAPLEMSHG